jgi:gamma-glutamyltranspeptidase/glutathione hydrolase
MAGPGFRFAPARPPAVAAEAMVSTSHPLATRAGMRALEAGGNAVDAALAAAAVLCVAEPMSTGIGGDLFAIVWDGADAHGLDAAGPAPRDAAPLTPVEPLGPRSVTTPGAVRGWEELARRFGRLGLDRCLGDAIDAATRGVAIGAVAADAWRRWGGPAELDAPPAAGARFANADLAGTLRAIADEGPEAFYGGRVAQAIAAACWVTEADLASYRPRWVAPLRVDYRGATVLELPPPTQGVAALEGLGLLALGATTFADAVTCVRLALEDALARVDDGADVEDLLAPDALARRRGEAPALVGEPAGGTVHVCAIDGDGRAVSLIQSLYERFGSRVVAPGTGVVLQNRAACFAYGPGEGVRPGRRPYHTIIPGMLLRGDRLWGPFGVVGGFMQAQAHVQLVSDLVDGGLDPQAALDRPRFRVDGDAVLLEEGQWDRAGEVAALGLEPVLSRETRADFGCGQVVLAQDDGLVGAADARGDGCAVGR